MQEQTGFELFVGGLALRHPVMAAAGTVKRIDEIIGMLRADVSAIVVGSGTRKRRSINGGETFSSIDCRTLNSLGMPNPGMEAYRDEILPEVCAVAEKAGKKIIMSVAGFTVEEYGELAAMAFAGGAHAVELNFGCPNIHDNGEQHGIFTFSPHLIGGALSEVYLSGDSGKAVLIKVSPVTDPQLFKQLAEPINEYCDSMRLVVVATNTFPNCLGYLPDGRTRTTPAEGLAGGAGITLRDVGPGQVFQWRRVLDRGIDIIGVGGIRDGAGVRDYLRAGAKAVQINSYFQEAGHRAFSNVLQGYYDLTAA